jgi:hypothetical protein
VAGSETVQKSHTPAGKETVRSASVVVPRSYFVGLYKRASRKDIEPDDALQERTDRHVLERRAGQSGKPGIGSGESGEVQGYTLAQNFPNPFNPATTINYTVGRNETVTLKIYNVQGKEVQTLVNNSQPAGNYKVSWDASSYPSGVYFYKVTAGDFTAEKKMVLVK